MLTGRRSLSLLHRTILRSFVAVALISAVGACGGPSDEELRNGARSLLPPGSAIVQEVPGDCVELASSPSCVHIYFVAEEIEQGERATAVLRAARASGWVLDRTEVLQGGMQLRFHTVDLTAVVSVRTDDQAERCVGNPTRACADVVMVEGIYGI
jgi:hypothetical protein